MGWGNATYDVCLSIFLGGPKGSPKCCCPPLVKLLVFAWTVVGCARWSSRRGGPGSGGDACHISPVMERCHERRRSGLLRRLTHCTISETYEDLESLSPQRGKRHWRCGGERQEKYARSQRGGKDAEHKNPPKAHRILKKGRFTHKC